jgi:hypothetical protein
VLWVDSGPMAFKLMGRPPDATLRSQIHNSRENGPPALRNAGGQTSHREIAKPPADDPTLNHRKGGQSGSVEFRSHCKNRFTRCSPLASS